MAIGNITINDATTPTPIAHVFVPVADGDDARYVNTAMALTLQGEESLGFSVKRSSTDKQPTTVRCTVYDPKEVTDSSTGLVSIGYSNSADSRFSFSTKASLQERLDAVTLMINFLTVMKAKIAAAEPQI